MPKLIVLDFDGTLNFSKCSEKDDGGSSDFPIGELTHSIQSFDALMTPIPGNILAIRLKATSSFRLTASFMKAATSLI